MHRLQKKENLNPELTLTLNSSTRLRPRLLLLKHLLERTPRLVCLKHLLVPSPRLEHLKHPSGAEIEKQGNLNPELTLTLNSSTRLRPRLLLLSHLLVRTPRLLATPEAPLWRID